LNAKSRDEVQAALLAALGLLIDKNLEWSSDFNNLKPILCVVLHENLLMDKPNKNIITLAERIIDQHG
jgi:hypothetical protein